MATQKHFIEKEAEVPADTVLYFIPCLSPTMAFADARGIPIIKILDESNNNPQLQKSDTIKISIDEAMREVNIPYLHDLIATRIKGTYNIIRTLRDHIQKQENPENPEWGLDSNRDCYFSLASSQKFAEFIKGLTGIDLRSGVKPSDQSGRNITVFMMHGYDNSKVQGWKIGDITSIGCVYGQYKCDDKTSGIGVIPPIILRYIDMMTQSLFGYINEASSRATSDINANKEYFYLNDNEVSKFKGEWIQHLYGNNDRGELGILAFDIELGNTYNEGVRNGYPLYNSDKIEESAFPFFNSDKLGFFVPPNLRITEDIIKKDAAKTDTTPKKEYLTTSFFEFLSKFFSVKEKIDKKMAKSNL
jgi:hypothetical protein